MRQDSSQKQRRTRQQEIKGLTNGRIPVMTTFFAAGIIPAYEAMAEEFNTSIHHCSYLTSLQIAILGYAPLIWKPLANRYGRRPIFLISVLGSLVCNIGCAVAPGYGSMAACRALVALFIAPPIAIGSGIVTETFFRKDRGKYIGVWTVSCRHLGRTGMII